MGARSYGMGRIFRKTRQGRPYGHWLIEYFRDGVQHRENSHSDSPQAARTLLKQRLVESGGGRAPAPGAVRVTVSDLFDELAARYELEQRPAAQKVKTHRAAWEAPAALGPNRRAATVTTAELERCCARWRAAGVAPATVNRRVEMLQRAYRVGAAATPPRVLIVPGWPARLPEDNVRQGFLGHSTWQQLHAYLVPRDPVVADYIEWAYYTGMRRGAIRDLEWVAVDREHWQLRLVRGQRLNKGKPRLLPLTGRLRAIIERAWARRIAYAQQTGRLVPWIFWRRYAGQPRPGLLPGDAIQIVEIRKRWRAACRAAGCPGLLLHDLRRTAARNLVRTGADERTAMAITGHRTSTMFRRYAILEDAELGHALARVFGAGAPRGEGGSGADPRRQRAAAAGNAGAKSPKS